MEPIGGHRPTVGLIFSFYFARDSETLCVKQYMVIEKFELIEIGEKPAQVLIAST
jgi:hypothetical protein